MPYQLLIPLTVPIFALLLTACAVESELKNGKRATIKPLLTAYDYQLLDQAYQPVSLSVMAAALQDYDVVFIGEYHRNNAAHLLQMQLFAALHQNNKPRGRLMQLSMEMFSRDQQAMVNDYLAGRIGEHYLIEEAPAWENYQGSYRPLVEYARHNAMPVIAANASGDIVRCIGRQGEGYLAKLDAEEQRHIAEQPFADIPGYEEKYMALMAGSKHMSKARLRQSYLAQISRDNSMAEAIAKALEKQPGSQVLHLNGTFHSEQRLGTVAALKRINPKLKLAVITPAHREAFEELRQRGKGEDDFYYLINPQPAEFVDGDYQKKTRIKLFREAREKAKACKK